MPVGNQTLVFLSPLDPLLFVLKVDFFAGGVLALPVVNWSIFSFVKPAMSTQHWVLFSVVYFAATILLFAGLAYAFIIIVPLSLGFLLSIDVAGTENMMTASSYINFILVQSMLVTAIFQIPLFIIARSYMGAFRISSLAAKRRYIYVAGMIILAILTPTADLFNLGIVAIPTAFMFEGSLLIARLLQWRTQKRLVLI